RKCIECFLCQDVCHVLREHDGLDRYMGPRFMVRIAALEMHPKDSLSRTDLLRGRGGIGFCNITKCCEDVCPEHIHITDNAIIPLKERMADDYFDPWRALLRLFGGKKEPRGTGAMITLEKLTPPREGQRVEVRDASLHVPDPPI